MEYKVLKEFVTPNGTIVFSPGDTYAIIDHDSFTEMLLEHDFIEPVKHEEWPPKPGDNYYTPFRRTTGALGALFANDSFDKDVLAQGLAFKTVPEAEKMAEWLRAVKVLRQDSQKSMAKKESGELRQIYFVHVDSTLVVADSPVTPISGSTATYNPFPFWGWDDAKASAIEHEAEWLTFFKGFCDV